MNDDDDDAVPVPANIAALERAAAKVLLDEDDRAAVAAGVAAARELTRLMEGGDRDAVFALFRLICLREDLEATRRRPRRRMRR